MKFDRYASWLVPCCLLIGSGSTVMAAQSDPRVPVRSITVTVPLTAQDAFITQLRVFAGKNGFKIRASPVDANGREFLVNMQRNDLRIIAVNPFDLDIFRITFYESGGRSLPAAQIDTVLGDLKSTVSGIKGVTVSRPDSSR